MDKISFRNDILPLKNKLFRLAQRITLNNADAEDIVQELGLTQEMLAQHMNVSPQAVSK